MKKITILGQEFDYKVYSDCNEYDGIYHWTEFYQGTEERKRKKYIFFGEIITKEVPKLMFKVWYDIESDSYTKLKMKSILEKEVELLFRKQEIERGEII